MKNLFIGLLATGFMTLSSFTTVSTSNENLKVDDAYGCCTAHSKDYSQSVTVCDDKPNRCGRALTAYYAIY